MMLRAWENQITRLTVGPLQRNSTDLTCLAANENELCFRIKRSKDIDLSSASSECPGDVVKPETKECQEKHCKETVETVWKTVTDLCFSDSLKRFLWRRGRLTSLSIDKGVAIAELEFFTPLTRTGRKIMEIDRRFV